MNQLSGKNIDSQALMYFRSRLEIIISIVLSTGITSIAALYIKYSKTNIPFLFTVGIPAICLVASAIYFLKEWKSPSAKTLEIHSEYISEEKNKGVAIEPYSRKLIAVSGVIAAVLTVIFWSGPALLIK